MKKIISLLASVAMLATMFTSVSAAELDNNSPVISTEVVEMTADEYYEIAEVELAENTVAYMVSATITGLDLAMVRAGSGTQAKKQRTGVGLASAQYDIIWEAEDNLVEVIALDDGVAATSDGTAIKAAFLATKATEAYPEASNTTDTPEEADEAYLNSYVVVVSGDLTGTVESLLSVKSFEANTQTGVKNFGKTDVAYEVNGVAGGVVTLAGPSDPDPIVPDPKPMEVTVDNNRFDLDVDGDEVADGYAWEVLVTNYDSTKTLSAKFTDAETGLPRAGKEKTEITGLAAAAETDGSIEFVALLQLSQARNVNFEIVVE